MAFNYFDTQYIDFAEGQSASRLANMQNGLSINFLDFYKRVDAAVGAVNTDPDPLISALTFRTDQDKVVSQANDDSVWQAQAEYTVVRPQVSRAQAHQLPFFHREIGLGFTDRAMKTVTIDAFDRQVRGKVQAIRRGQRADVLERLFTVDDTPLDDDGTPATPGFVNPASAYPFTVVQPNGAPEDPATYTHYGFTSEANLATALNTYLTRLRAQNDGPFDLVASADVVALVRALPLFTPAGSPLIRPAQGASEALVTDASLYIGVYDGDVQVRKAETQIQSSHLAIFRTYGADNMLNPLAWRWNSVFGPNLILEERSLYPLAEALMSQHYGIGVANRVGAVLLYVDDAAVAYVNATIAR